MLTHFATSLAGEVRQDGIDVSVLHPSPVATSFYAGAHAMPTLKFFESERHGYVLAELTPSELVAELRSPRTSRQPVSTSEVIKRMRVRSGTQRIESLPR